MFNLPSYKQLKLSLGEHDAVVQLQECARLTLTKKYEDIKRVRNISFPDFIKEESAQFGIHLHDLTIKTYPNIVFQNYLIMPNSLLEEFIDSFVDDFNSLLLLNTSLPKTSNKCKLERLLELLSNNGYNSIVNSKELDLYNYYRLIRNKLAHKLPTGNLSLSSNVDVTYFQNKYPQLQAPNEPEELTFDDFILYTATIKSIAQQITQSIASSINWCSYLQNNRNQFPRLKRFKGERAIVYIKNCIKKDYGLQIGTNDIENSLGPFE